MAMMEPSRINRVHASIKQTADRDFAFQRDADDCGDHDGGDASSGERNERRISHKSSG